MKKVKRGSLFLFLFFLSLVYVNGEMTCSYSHITQEFIPEIEVSFEEEVYLYDPYLQGEDGSKLILNLDPDTDTLASDFILSPVYELVPGKAYKLFLNYSDYFLNYDSLLDTCVKLDLPSLNITLTSPKYGVFNSSQVFLMDLRTSRKAFECNIYNYQSGQPVAQFNTINNFSFSKDLGQGINNYELPHYDHTYSNLPEYEIVCKEGVPSNFNNVNRIIKLGYDTTPPNVQISPESSQNTFSNMLITIDSQDDEILCKFDDKELNKNFEDMRYEVAPIREENFFKKSFLYLTNKEDSIYNLSLFDSKEYNLDFICMNRAGFLSPAKTVSFFINTSATFKIKDIEILGSNNKGFVGDSKLNAYVKTNLDLSSECTIKLGNKIIQSSNSFPSSNMYFHNFSAENFFEAGKNELEITCENGKGTVLVENKDIYLDVTAPIIKNITIPREVCQGEIDFSLAFVEQNPSKIVVEIKEASQGLSVGRKEYTSISSSPFDSIIDFEGSQGLSYKFEITLVDISQNNVFFKSDNFKYNTQSPVCGDSTPPRTSIKSVFSGSQIILELDCHDVSDNGKDSSGCKKIFTLKSIFGSCPTQEEIYGSNSGNYTTVSFTSQDTNYVSLCYFSIDVEGNKELVKYFNLTRLFIDKGFIDLDDSPIEDPEDPIEIDPNQDTDGDGMPDVWELEYGLNINDSSDADLDFDSDGLTNYREYILGTDPTAFDTDGDTYSDGKEVDEGTDPLDPDDYPREVVYIPPEPVKTKILPWILLIMGLILIISGVVYLNLDEVKVMLGLKEPTIKNISQPAVKQAYATPPAPSGQMPQKAPIQKQQMPQGRPGSFVSKLSKVGFVGKYKKGLFKEKQKKRSSLLDSFDTNIDKKESSKGSELDDIPSYDELSRKEEMQKILDDIINKKVNNLEKEGEIIKKDSTSKNTFDRLSELSDKHKESIFSELDKRLGGNLNKREIDDLFTKNKSSDFEKLDLINSESKKENLDSLIEKANKDGALDNLINESKTKKTKKGKDALDDLKKF